MVIEWQSSGAIGMVTMGQEPVVVGASPNSIPVPHLCHQAPSLDEMWSSKEPLGLAWHESSSGSMPLEDVVDGNTRTNRSD